MLDAKVLGGVGVLAQRLNGRGIGLESIEGTPVDVLVGTTTVLTEDGDEGVVVDVQSTSEITSTTTGPLPNSHNLEFDAAVEAGANAVRSELSFAQNVVVPAQEQIVTAVRAALEQNLDKHLYQFEVVEEAINPVLKDANMLALIKEHEKNGRVIPTGAIFSFGERSVEEIQSWLPTGFKGTDAAISLWVADKPDSFFLDVFQAVFNNGSVGEGGALLTALGDTDAATLVYLLARHFFDEPPADTGLSLNECQTYMAQLRNLAGEMLFFQLSVLDNAIKNGLLVKRIRDDKIYVQSEVYRPWLESGGSVDTLFGLAVIKGKQVTVKDINASVESLNDAWRRHHNLTTASLVQEKSRLVRQVLAREFGRFFEEYYKEPGKEGEAQRKFFILRESLNQKTDAQLQNLDDSVLCLLCSTLWPEKGSYFLLSRIDFHCKQNPQLSAREAASIAVIEFVTDWVMSQVKRVSH